MSDKPSDFPSAGENPGLDNEAIKTLRSNLSTLPAPGEVQDPDKAEKVGEISGLTEQLLEKNLEGVQIHEAEEPMPASMGPERLKTTNRPPNTDDYNDILKALKDSAKDNVPPTLFCVEQDKE